MPVGNHAQIISSGTMSGNSVSLTSIPQTFSHLELTVNGCYDDSGTQSNWLYYKFNGTTSSEYGMFGGRIYNGTNGTISSQTYGSASGNYFTGFPGTNKDIYSNGISKLRIMNYSNTTSQKPILVDGRHVHYVSSSDKADRLLTAIGVYPTTTTSLMAAGISQIDITGAGSLTFKSGTRYMLIGWP